MVWPPTPPANPTRLWGADCQARFDATQPGCPLYSGLGMGGGTQTVGKGAQREGWGTTRCWYGSDCWWKDWKCPHWHGDAHRKRREERDKRGTYTNRREARVSDCPVVN